MRPRSTYARYRQTMVVPNTAALWRIEAEDCRGPFLLDVLTSSESAFPEPLAAYESSPAADHLFCVRRVTLVVSWVPFAEDDLTLEPLVRVVDQTGGLLDPSVVDLIAVELHSRRDEVLPPALPPADAPLGTPVGTFRSESVR